METLRGDATRPRSSSAPYPRWRRYLCCYYYYLVFVVTITVIFILKPTEGRGCCRSRIIRKVNTCLFLPFKSMKHLSASPVWKQCSNLTSCHTYNKPLLSILSYNTFNDWIFTTSKTVPFVFHVKHCLHALFNKKKQVIRVSDPTCVIYT